MKVLAVSISREKGTSKTPVPEIEINSRGIVGDAHAGTWHRQVSLLARESIDKFSRQAGKNYGFGEFAENIATEGIDLVSCKIGDHLLIGEVKLEVTQIGKHCHGGGCAIFREVGKCVMPKEGIFTRVLQGGRIRPGDAIVHTARPLRVHIVTLSDRASRGEYEDRSGPAIRAGLEAHQQQSHWGMTIGSTVIPDDRDRCRGLLEDLLADDVDLIFTTGSTGIGPRDIAPEVIRPLLDKEIPGLMEYIRVKYGETIPSALLSRSVAGVIGSTLIYALPGSVKAVQEYLQEICRTLDHSLLMLRGIDAH